MDDENEWKNLPVDEKCVHKSWKARLDGYEAAGRLFQSIDDDKSPEWSKYAGLLKKFIADSNLTAQEKGLDAVLAYIENYVHAGKTVGEVMSNLVQKCIGSSTKPKTKELALQISLMYIEIEKFEVVIEELLKGTESKNPKTSCGCLVILTQALKHFGPKVVPISKILKKVTNTLSDRDKNVRGEARGLVVEIYRWVGASVKQQLSSLKPAQLTELEAEFEKISGPPPAPTRLLRSQQAKKNVERLCDATSEGVEEGGVDEGDGPEEIDPTEFLEPVDILSKLPKNFFSQLEEKKWTDRRDTLEILEKELQSAPRLEPVEYGDLVRALKKIIAKDSNIVVVAIALKCLTGLATGLKKKFMPYVGMVFSTLLEKFKEKKQNVVAAVRDSVDAIFLVSHLESIHEDVIAALDNKNPWIKSEVSLFLARCFTRCTPAILNKKLLKVLSAGLLKVLNDSDPGARDAAASALGTAMKVVTEKGIAPFLADIGDQKMAKIKACCESAELQKPIKVAVSEVKSDKPAGGAKQPSGKSASRPSSKTVRPLRKDAVGSKASVKSQDSELAKKLSNKIPIDILNELGDSDGNKRLLANEELLKHIQNSDVPKESVSAFFEAIGNLDDDNTGVVEAKINCMKALVEKTDLSGMDLKVTLLSLLKKYNDPKYADTVAGCLVSFSSSLGSDQFCQRILNQGIISDKNLWAASLKWISEGIINYELSFSEDYLQREAQKAIKSGNLVLRNAGCSLVGSLQMMRQDADGSVPQLSGQKESSAKTEPSKKREIKSSDSSPSKTAVDISSIITSQFLSELSDDSWKTRLDCLEKVRPLIEGAGPISPNIGEVQNVFENLLTDKNAKVTQSALTCLAALIKALGIHSRKYTCFFLPKVLKNLSDPKTWVRSSVINVLDSIGSSGGYKELFDNDTIADACTTITLPAARVELFNWVLQVSNKVETLPSDGLVAILPVLYHSLEDRNGDIRKASNETIVSLMMHLGYETMLNASSNLKGSTATAVKALLDKNRGSVPEPYEKSFRGGKGSAQLKKLGPGSSATFTKPTKGVKSSISSRTIAKKEEQESCDGPLLEKNKFKHQRVLDEQKLKTLKWNFTTPRPEFIEQLRDQMNSANISPGLIASMFHSDFKFHIKAIDALTDDLPLNRDGIISNLDLILRWMTLRFFDTNPSVLIKGLDYLSNVFNILIEEGYNMLDIEAFSFMPYLLLKAGDPKDTVKNHSKNIFKQCALIYSRQKLFSIVMEVLKSKNARLRSELLELLCFMITTYSLEVCSPNVGQALKEIGKHIGDKDTSVRNGALNCMVAVYHIVGEDIHKHIGQLPYGPNTLLEERLKRASKQRPVASIKPLDSSPEEQNQSPNRSHNDDLNNDETYNIDEGNDSNSSDSGNMNNTFTRNQMQQESHHEQMPQAAHVAHQRHQSPPTHYGAILEQKITGPYRLDSKYYQPLPTFTMPEIKMPDLSFLQDSPVRPRSKFTLPTSTISTTVTSPSATLLDDPVIKELTNPDLEKAITAMAKIETVLYSDKAYTLRSKIDYLVSQLEQQLIILNQSTHPDLVNCYRGNFSLILKFSDNKQLCQEISEPNLSRLIKQLLLLLTGDRLEKIGQEMFVKTVNNVVIRLLETSNKTAVVSGLIKMLHGTIRPASSKHFHDLVTKCLWKLNRTQTVWDAELNYPLILADINNFLVEFPTSWWKTQTADVPLRTVKTILHTMVKIRGSRVRDELEKVPGITHESEIAGYIRKVIKHFQLQNNLSHQNNNNNQTSTNEIPTTNNAGPSNDPKQEIVEILQPFINSNESPDALKRLHDFKMSHPNFDVDIYLISLPTPAICYISKGLAKLDVKSNEKNINSARDDAEINSSDNSRRSGDPELEYLWKRLDYWKQQLGEKNN